MKRAEKILVINTKYVDTGAIALWVGAFIIAAYLGANFLISFSLANLAIVFWYEYFTSRLLRKHR